MLIYGAHLLRNGAALILDRMMARRLAHAPGHQRRRHHPRLGVFLAGPVHRKRPRRRGLRPLRHLGRNRPHDPHRPLGGRRDRRRLRPGTGPIHRRRRRDAAASPTALEEAIRTRAGASADRRPGPTCCWRCGSTAWPPGRYAVDHRWKQASILAAAFRRDVPITVHPGIGYDIIANHPMFNGAAIGRAGQRGFRPVRRRRSKGSTAAWCSRSARRSWGRRCSRRA